MRRWHIVLFSDRTWATGNLTPAEASEVNERPRVERVCRLSHDPGFVTDLDALDFSETLSPS